MKMSSTLLSSPSPKINILFPGSPERTDPLEMNRQVSLALLGVCLSLAAVTAAGGVFSLLSLLRTTRKTPLSVIVASMSVDDLVSLVPLCLFMLQQWDRSRETAPLCTVPLCTLSGLLYVFQGVSSNMKSCLIAVYTFYVTRRCGGLQSLRGVLWGVTGVWLLSLAVSVLPLCGLGSFTPASLGCFPDTEGFYVPLLFSLYSLSLCGMLIFFLPLVHHLLCSREPHRTLYPGYLEITAGPSREGSDALELPPSRSRESWKKSFGAYSEMSPGSPGEGLELRGDLDTVTRPASVGEQSACLPDSPVLFAQKRFSMILAVIRVILWMPMMTLVLVRHAVHARNSSLETLSFILTLLAPAVTPVFVLSERWIHLPCGCFINCRPDPVHEPPAMKRKFQFNLSFQQGYGVYKISHNNTPISPSVEQPSYPNLFNCDLGDTRLHVLDSAAVSSLQAELELRTPRAVDSSSLSVGLEPVNRGDGEALADCLPFLHGNQDDPSPPYLTSHHHREHEDRSLADTSSVFDGPERRLSHEECRKIELTDWEWCRSKSERTPRQRSSGGLAIPLCAFQGTVSLHAPTGKTLSLSTYEVSSDGLKISPNAKKVEVYRSKSVGHEPSADDPSGGPHPGGVCSGGVGVGMEVGMGGVGDTNVKIHLEVLEICDNEEAMDSVSIISNISQSSAHARSPSLRYSRRENRFVSCDLGETASYSLLIPSGGSPEADSLNISIPDTVEAHRMTSRMQTQDSCGYREEIQLLNEAYRKQGGDQEE